MIWKMFLKIKPAILINNEQLKLENKKQWKSYFINKSITIKIIDLQQLDKKSERISFVQDINSFRNNQFYIQYLRRFNLSSKVDKKIDWLEKIRNEEFIIREEYPSLLQSSL